jgi:excisionase family DNA binding protein
VSDSSFNEWSGLPLMLTVDEAARLLRIGRSHAYNLTKVYFASGGAKGLPVIRLGDLLRVPRAALHELVTTGRRVQLIPNRVDATPDATAARKPTRTGRRVEGSQLSLLGSD